MSIRASLSAAVLIGYFGACTQALTAAGTAESGGGAGELPFTGGEVVLLSVLGLGAVGGGTALLLAGLRRSAPVA